MQWETGDYYVQSNSEEILKKNNPSLWTPIVLLKTLTNLIIAIQLNMSRSYCQTRTTLLTATSFDLQLNQILYMLQCGYITHRNEL